MENLNKDWITDGLMDFEYKKYILLAYLKKVTAHFDAHKLYPPLAEVISHHKNLISLKQQKELLSKGFPKELKAIDQKKWELKYNQLIEDEEFMNELTDILNFAIPQLEGKINKGIDLYELVESQLAIEPIGIASLYQKEGFLFIDQDQDPFIQVFKYQLSMFEKADEKYRSLQTTYLQRVRKSIGRTLESIKVEINRQYRIFSNPATFRVSSMLAFPFNETLMPVVKRSLVKHLSTDIN